ncbi:MAG: glycosyltransferase family 2 protein [Phycisphaerales bacterium]|nr:glycosyltransferase family 2 protein [Phycisphaerales bacterium]
MRVSVVIPAFNAVSLLSETLDSLASQVREPDEVIVIDDGSIDGTAALAEQHQIVTRVIVRTNGGICAARNDGIEASDSDLVFLLDADDLWHPIYLQRMIAMMEKHPEALAGFTGYRCFSHPEEGPAPYERAINDTVAIHDASSFSRIANQGLPILPSFYCARREALARLGARPYIEGHLGGGEACYLPAMLVAMGSLVEHIAPLGRYRMHAAAVTGDEVDAARTMIPSLRDLDRDVRRRTELRIPVAARHAIRSYVCDWLRKCGRRLGFGSPSEGRRVFWIAIRMGNFKAAVLYAMSFIPGIAGRRVWVSAWRPASVRRAEGTPFWSVETFEVDLQKTTPTVERDRAQKNAPLKTSDPSVS